MARARRLATYDPIDAAAVNRATAWTVGPTATTRQVMVNPAASRLTLEAADGRRFEMPCRTWELEFIQPYYEADGPEPPRTFRATITGEIGYLSAAEDFLTGRLTEETAERLILATKASLESRGIPADLLTDEECLALARATTIGHQQCR